MSCRPKTWLVLLISILLLPGCQEKTGSASGSEEASQWNLLLVTFDTTRADHIAAYGNPDARTPAIDGLAEGGVLFDRAYASVPITAPSHSTILTGLYPMTHGVRDNGLFILGDEALTLAEMLKAQGYATAASIASFPLAARFGFSQGFDLFDDGFTQPYEDFRGDRLAKKRRLYFDERRAELVNEPLLEWLSATGDVPFFAWAHYFDPHQPLEPPAPYDQLFVADPYLGEIAYADEALGQLVKHLESIGVADRTIIVVTADHGEGLGEHNESTHSLLNYNSTLRVPLIITVPGMPGGRRVGQRVGTVDIVPTLLEVLGIAPTSDLHGQSLLGLMDTGVSPEFPRPQYAETLSPRISHGLGELRTLFDGGYKYIFGPRPELYAIDTDPDELENLVEIRPDQAVAMRQKLQEFVTAHASAQPSTAVAIDEDTRARLQGLGYLSFGTEIQATSETLNSEGIAPQDRVGDINEISSAKNELLNGRPRSALALAETLLNRVPGHPYYLQTKATALMMLGRFDAAIVTLQQIMAADPNALPRDEHILQLVEMLYYRGDAALALTFLESHQVARPSAPGKWYEATLRGMTGDGPGQLAALQTALELDESFAPARVDLASLRAEAGFLDEAERMLQRAIGDQPYYPKGHYNRGVMLIQSGNVAEAIPAFKRAIALDRNYAQAHYAMVLASLEQGDRLEAQNSFEELLRIAPTAQLTRTARELLSLPQDSERRGQG